MWQRTPCNQPPPATKHMRSPEVSKKAKQNTLQIRNANIMIKYQKEKEPEGSEERTLPLATLFE